MQETGPKKSTQHLKLRERVLEATWELKKWLEEPVEYMLTHVSQQTISKALDSQGVIGGRGWQTNSLVSYLIDWCLELFSIVMWGDKHKDSQIVCQPTLPNACFAFSWRLSSLSSPAYFWTWNNLVYKDLNSGVLRSHLLKQEAVSNSSTFITIYPCIQGT